MYGVKETIGSEGFARAAREVGERHAAQQEQKQVLTNLRKEIKSNIGYLQGLSVRMASQMKEIETFREILAAQLLALHNMESEQPV